MKNSNTNKELADLYLKLYSGCIKFKNEKDNKKEIDCKKYYDQFEFYACKYIDSKYKKDNNS